MDDLHGLSSLPRTRRRASRERRARHYQTSASLRLCGSSNTSHFCSDLAPIGRLKAVLYSRQGMQGNRNQSWRTRGLLAVCLALFFSISSLAPLAAQATAQASCCHTRTKCCCHKSASHNLSIASQACADCSCGELGSVSVIPGVLPPAPSALTIHTADRVAFDAPFRQSRLSHGSLRQRPPPIRSLDIS